jgi:hypothetical protein
MSTATDQVTGTLADRLGLKTLVECCLVLEEGVAAAKDVELGMMMGAGILPGPLTRADEAGLDTILEQLDRARSEWGDSFEPPALLRPGLLPLPAARCRGPARDRAARDARRRRDRLAQPPAGQPAVAPGRA